MDITHRQWRLKAIKEAKRVKLYQFGDGIAAKSINIYWKSRFVCGGFHKHPSVAALHPPVDRELLVALAKEEFGEERAVWRKKGWTKFDAEDYERVIQAIRRALPGRPLCLQLEKSWRY